MEDYIIIGIIAVIVIFGAVSAVKHFKGEGGCCGGGSYKPKRKRLSGIKYRKTFKIGGMHCKHCKLRVEEIVNDIDGISARVDLKKGELTVSYTRDIDDGFLKERIERAGYSFDT